MNRVILFEMNEAPERVLDHWVALHPASALAHATARGRSFRSIAEDKGHLSPWVTWPSLHRGVANDRHFITDFGQNLDHADAEFAPVWKLAAAAGARVGVCNSLHSYPLPADHANIDFHIPDPFASGPETLPASLSAFQAINLAMSRESGRNVSGALPRSAAFKLLASVPNLGIRPATIADIFGQLAQERRHRWKLVRRRTYQSVLTFDIFMRQLARSRPQLATYFTNHVASAMHRYWGAAWPEDYDGSRFDGDWSRTYGGEIAFTMQKLDDMVGRLLAFIDRHPDYQLILASSMGQEAVESSLCETQLYLVDAPRFLALLGLPDDAWQMRPAMLPQFNLQITGDCRDFEARLASVRIGDAPLAWHGDGAGFYRLDFGQPNTPDDLAIAIGDAVVDPATAGLRRVEITDRSGTTAYHIAAGTVIALGAGTAPSRGRREISTLDIAPHILARLGVAPPAYMRPAGALAA